MGKIKIGLIVLGSIALVGLIVGLASQVEMKSKFKDESKNNEISGAGGFGLPNPSAVYCKELGYGYEIKNTKEGQIGICAFPDGSSAEAWQFYSGESKGEYSYCTVKGYKLETEENCAWSAKCSVCVLPDGEKIPAFILMLKEKPKKDYLKKFYDDIEEQSQKSPLENGSSFGELSQISSVGLLPTSFDWRNNGGDWLTPVKNQGGCGSCWAFASVGTHESQINIKSNDPTIDKDLAEQYLVSDCFPPADCNGLYLSDIDKLFNFHRDNGIVEETCYPYIAKNSPCSPKCVEPLWKIKNWYYATATIADIKTTLINEGPLWVGIYMSSSFDANNIMRCSLSQDRSVNHAVVIVGYNDDGQYWIVRNSWGANWGPEKNGYFKVGYGECNIDRYVSGYKDIVAMIGKSVGPACSFDDDCNDANECTTDTCVNPGEANAYCQNLPVTDGVTCTGGICCSGKCVAPKCSADADCDDTETCTADTCNNQGTCSASCSNVWPLCGISDGCCGPECSGATSSSNYDPDCPVVKCWSGTNQYLYKNNGQAAKFCKCAQGTYGYQGYSSKWQKVKVYKYLDTGDNENWNVTSQTSWSPVYQVTCTDGTAYPTEADYYYSK